MGGPTEEGEGGVSGEGFRSDYENMRRLALYLLAKMGGDIMITVQDWDEVGLLSILEKEIEVSDRLPGSLAVRVRIVDRQGRTA